MAPELDTTTPEDEVLDDETVALEDDNDDELEDDDDEEQDEPTRKRRRLSSSNVYVFPIKDANNEELVAKVRQEAKDGLNALIYDDKTPVEGFRVWDLSKGDTLQACILARGSAQACEFFLQEKDYNAELAFKKKKRGRPSKINPTILQFGQMLASIVKQDGNPMKDFKKDAPQQHIESWNQNYGEGSKYAHYYDTEGNWKKAEE